MQNLSASTSSQPFPNRCIEFEKFYSQLIPQMLHLGKEIGLYFELNKRC